MKKYDEIVSMENTCVAYGSFEGVHRGHLKIAEKLTAQAKEKGLTSVIVSCPVKNDIMTTEREKEYLLKDAGVDAFMTCTEEEALKAIMEKLGAKTLVIGENHKDMDVVKAEAEKAGIEVVVCETEKEDGEVITAELVRKAFDECDFEKVTKLCGHPYTLIGEVMHGKALGRTVGMPTANLGSADSKLKPPSWNAPTR